MEVDTVVLNGRYARNVYAGVETSNTVLTPKGSHWVVWYATQIGSDTIKFIGSVP